MVMKDNDAGDPKRSPNLRRSTYMFYEFKQSNSGGSFEIDEERGISVTVIVEADNHEDANERAKNLGIYFKGSESGADCECCGDRWYGVWETDGDAVPSSYGTPLIEVAPDPRWPSLDMVNWAGDRPECYVHLKNGRFFGFHKVGGRYVYRGDPSALVESLPGVATKEISS